MSEETTSQYNSPVSAQAVLEAPGAPAETPWRSNVEPFGTGHKVSLTSPDIRVELLTYGASINSVQIRDHRKPESDPEAWVEVCLGFKDPEECETGDAPIGSSCGRFAGRIANGEFELNGTSYKLMQNAGCHTLHGGPIGFQKQQWKYLLTEGESEVGVSFHLASPHLDQGFPGELFVTATYTIQKSERHPVLKYTYKASLAEQTPVEATVVNMANHVYWNLNGVQRPSSSSAACPAPEPVTNHLLQLHAKYRAATNEEVIAEGEMLPVADTAHDYRVSRCVEEGMRLTEAEGREPWGYDDLMALETWDSTLREAAVLYSPSTRLQMRVSTTNPAIVVYTANYLPPAVDGSKGQRYGQHSAICLECQYFPNSPNVDTFPSATLRKGETYDETTTHEFMFLASTPKAAA